MLSFVNDEFGFTAISHKHTLSNYILLVIHGHFHFKDAMNILRVVNMGKIFSRPMEVKPLVLKIHTFEFN